MQKSRFPKMRHYVRFWQIGSHIYHTKQLNPWRNSSASWGANYSHLSVFQGRWNHMTTRAFVDVWETSHSKTAWATFSTNTWLNYWLMCTAITWWWKVCLAVVSMEASFSQIHLQICRCRLRLYINQTLSLASFIYRYSCVCKLGMAPTGRLM